MPDVEIGQVAQAAAAVAEQSTQPESTPGDEAIKMAEAERIRAEGEARKTEAKATVVAAEALTAMPAPAVPEERIREIMLECLRAELPGMLEPIRADVAGAAECLAAAEEALTAGGESPPADGTQTTVVEQQDGDTSTTTVTEVPVTEGQVDQAADGTAPPRRGFFRSLIHGAA